MKSISIFRSKTLWINVAAVAVDAALKYIFALDLDPEAKLALLAVVNIINRFFTSRPVHLV